MRVRRMWIDLIVSVWKTQQLVVIPAFDKISIASLVSDRLATLKALRVGYILAVCIRVLR